MNLANSLKTNLVILVVRAAGALPFAAGQMLAGVLARIFWLLPSESKRVIYINLALCYPKLDLEQRQSLARRSYIEAAITAIEIPILWQQDFERNNQQIISVDNESYLNDALANERGVILIIPHLGNWELCNHYMSAKSDVVALYQPAKIAALDSIIRKSREKARTTVVPTNTSGIRQLLKTLKQGGCTAILPDQEPEPSGGIYCHFFGQAALSSVLVSKLIKQTGALPIMMTAERQGIGKGFKIVIEPCSETLCSQDLNTSVQALNNATEALIKPRSHQYQWNYKRFKYYDGGRQNPYDT